MPITEWTVRNGERFPAYTLEQLKRIAEAAWDIQYLIPHPDDLEGFDAAADAVRIREFNRAIQALPRLVEACAPPYQSWKKQKP